MWTTLANSWLWQVRISDLGVGLRISYVGPKDRYVHWYIYVEKLVILVHGMV